MKVTGYPWWLRVILFFRPTYSVTDQYTGVDRGDGFSDWTVETRFKRIGSKVFITAIERHPPMPPEHPNCRCTTGEDFTPSKKVFAKINATPPPAPMHEWRCRGCGILNQSDMWPWTCSCGRRG